MTPKSVLPDLASQSLGDIPDHDPDWDCSMAEPKPVASKKAKRKRVHSSIYLPHDLWRRLREIAAAEDCKMHDLLLEGLRDVVRRRQS